jgi:predicted RNase H-like HicB family nuclease
MIKLPTSHHTIEIFLDKDGYTAYYKDFPNISAGGETEAEALRELANAFALAKKVEEKSHKKATLKLNLKRAFA